MYFVFKFSFNVKVFTPEGQHPNQVLCDITVSMPFSRRDHLLIVPLLLLTLMLWSITSSAKLVSKSVFRGYSFNDAILKLKLFYQNLDKKNKNKSQQNFTHFDVDVKRKI